MDIQVFLLVFTSLLFSSVAQDEVTLISMEIITKVRLRYAKTHVITEFYNSRTSMRPVNFTLPLPEDALITGLSMTIGTQYYEGEIKDIDEAEESYASVDGFDVPAALITVRDAKTFQISVKVAPDTKATFNWTYEQILKRQQGLFNLPIHVNPGKALERLYVEVNINESKTITELNVSDLHEDKESNFTPNPIAIVDKNQNTAKITWNPTKRQQDKSKIFNGIINVFYDIASSNEILLDSDGNFMHTFKPERDDHLNQYIVFILDLSGSMSGQKLNQLKKGLISILDDLHTGDKFTMIFFSSKIKIWSGSKFCTFIATSRPIPNFVVLQATSENIELAKACVQKLRAIGGTYIHEALTKGIEAAKIVQKENVNQLALTIVFLTDGKPNGLINDPVTIANEFTTKNSAVGATLFSLAFGTEAQFKFLKQMSLNNKGFAKRIYDSDDAAKQLEKFYDTISSPLLSNVKFMYGTQVNNSTKTDFPMYYKGQDLLVTGNVPSGSSVAATVKTDQILLQAELTMVDGEAAEFLKRLLQFFNIKELLDKNGASDKEAARVLALKEKFIIPTTGFYVQGPEVEFIGIDDSVTGERSGLPEVLEGNDNTNIEENTFTGHVLSDIEWLDSVMNGSHITLNVNNTATTFLVGKNQNLTKFDSCITPSQKPGHCYHLYQCIFPEIEKDINTFLHYFCNIGNRFVGVCCADEMTGYASTT